MVLPVVLAVLHVEGDVSVGPDAPQEEAHPAPRPHLGLIATAELLHTLQQRTLRHLAITPDKDKGALKGVKAA